MKVLLSAPRAGSSYCYEQFHQHNILLPNVRCIGVEEYLDPTQQSHLTLDEKIAFLNSEKLLGINYTFKHHINYLGDYYNSWFVDFYKDDDVYVLKRKDQWQWFLSFLFQDCVKWSSAYILQSDDLTVRLSQIHDNWIDYDFRQSLDQFFTIKSQLDAAVGTIIYYENLSHASTRYIKLSSIVDYEKSFYNLDDIKAEFNRYLKQG
jgi:hypothetical protein